MAGRIICSFGKHDVVSTHPKVQLQLCDYVLSILLTVNQLLKNQADYKHTEHRDWENFAVK